MCVSAGPSYATFTLKCQLLFHFSAPHRAGIDQSDYAQQRDDCCKAIYDFSLYLFSGGRYDDHVRTTTASVTERSGREESGGANAMPRLGKEKLSTRLASCSRFILIYILIV